jgi:hypothetical protein
VLFRSPQNPKTPLSREREQITLVFIMLTSSSKLIVALFLASSHVSA